MSDQTNLPLLRWGIIGTGTIAGWFVKDLLLPRKSPQARHLVQAIGSVSQNSHNFASKLNVPATANLYDSYQQVYNDPDVDIVHIAVPHGLHLKECLSAIQAGKHVLCEKPMAMNAAEAWTIFEAAKKANTWIGEGLWTRGLPVTKCLYKLLHEQMVIGKVLRVTSDFGFHVELQSLPWSSRYKDPKLGAGSLLDMGVYLLNWALLAAGNNRMPIVEHTEYKAEIDNLPRILAMQKFEDVGNGEAVEVCTGILIDFGSGGPQAVLSSTSVTTREKGEFCRIDGEKGHIIIEGMAPPLPTRFTVHIREDLKGKQNHGNPDPVDGLVYEFESPGGMGFYWEADEAAIDISAGRKTSTMMPVSETMLVMRMMDEINRQGREKSG